MRLAAAVSVALCCAAGPLQAEPRQVYRDDAPVWLRAVGKLHVPGVRYSQGYGNHQLENCSGTLVATANSQRANTVVTAWHCLEFYNDLSRPITFTLLTENGESLSREAYRVADGGGMHADWAVLKLFHSVNTDSVPALTPLPASADATRPVTMAGYSGDQGLGDNGNVLTYHADCRITRQQLRESASNCSAFKGASGGAVIQLSAEGRAQLGGVISRGNSENVSIYVPISGFRGSLTRFLK
ncbi:trypsin-like serine peptidase [Pseudohalioglobus lutimaris]|uniref:Serine protease n=1 Tax=Pseudohalioglobus lutimaris TaxID=1737061 RepID=A0A2N5WXP0_9GAMM|nr:trypsin-like peptidase domain-containing protein [Pseudohalioglobus lutimaris]PLW66996.1 serine protease [Pseudohalioglobus lutimaris]